MTYEMANVTNSTDFLQLTQSVNTDLTGGWLGIVILVSLWAVLFITFSVRANGTQNEKMGVASATLITTIASVLLFTIGLVSLYVVLLLSVMSAGAILIISKNDGG
jgi:uncharacterized membrane protein